MIRLGIIGCGEHSEIGHAVPLARYKSAHPQEVELAAACDVRPERGDLFREKYGFLKSYTDVERMLSVERLVLISRLSVGTLLTSCFAFPSAA